MRGFTSKPSNLNLLTKMDEVVKTIRGLIFKSQLWKEGGSKEEKKKKPVPAGVKKHRVSTEDARETQG